MQFLRHKLLLTCVFVLGGFLLDVTEILSQGGFDPYPGGQYYDNLIPIVPVFQDEERFFHRYPKMVITDITSAIRWRPHFYEISKKQYILLAGTVAAYVFLDKHIVDLLYDERKNFTEKQLDNLTHYTEKPVIFGMGGMALGILFRKERFADAGFTMMGGALLADIIVTQLKFLFGRARPVQGKSSHFYKPLHGGYSALPSRHAYNIFTAASIISEYYPTTRVLVYGVAGCVGVQRIVTGAHWPTDVIVGALLGHYIGKKLAHSHLRLYPIQFPGGGNGAGVAVPFSLRNLW